MNDFIQKLDDFLKRNQISNKVASEFFGRHQNHISNMRNGNYPISIDVRFRLKKYLEIEENAVNADEVKFRIREYLAEL